VGVHGLGWSDWGCHFSQVVGLWSARPCSVLQIAQLTSEVQDVIPYQQPNHGSQPSGFLTPKPPETPLDQFYVIVNITKEIRRWLDYDGGCFFQTTIFKIRMLC
jgi:hypothetical protein